MVKRAVIVAAIVLGVVWLSALPAAAHTSFASSTPSDGSVLEGPVGRIELVFSGEATPAGEGFVVLDGAGTMRTPVAVHTEDGLTWVLEFEPPLVAGATGVRWKVAAPDTHPIEGSFSFTVVSGAVPAAPVPVPTGEASTAADTEPSPPPTELTAFLVAGESLPLLGLVGFVARTLSLMGAVVAIGAIAFAVVVLRGHERDVHSVLFWVRRASVVLGAGAVLEALHRIAEINGTWWTVWPLSGIADALWAPFGVAVALRFLGAALMMRAHLDVVHATMAPDPVVVLQTAVAVGAGPRPSQAAAIGSPEAEAGAPYLRSGDRAWRVDGQLAPVALGVVAVLLSFAFDGHTVTEGTRLVTAIVAVVHVGAGAVWGGGLLMLVHVLWRRHRMAVPVRALQLAIRFSVVAATALVVAGVAGLVLSVIIIDSLSDLWSTPWGRLMLAKVGVVAAAGVAGAYNHSVLIPQMLAAPDDPDLSSVFRRAVTLEGVAMGAIVIITALLVASAS
ncbi:MAG: copper resistance protein CopC [Acidimicrobiia bacterium]|nr:copper resistance protein CopC [Acidimicrobiia bacterium]